MKALQLKKFRLPKVNFRSSWNLLRKTEAAYRPQILAGTAVATMWGSIYLTYKAAPKVQKALAEGKEKLSELPKEKKDARNAVKKEIALEVAKESALPVLTGVLASAAMIGSTSVSAKRLATVSAVLSSKDAMIDAYRKFIQENVGEKKDRAAIDAVAKQQLAEHPCTEDTPVYQTGNGDIKFFDPWTARYFWSSPEAVRKAFVDLSYQCLMEDYVSLNDLYYKLNLREADSGDVVGWTSSERRKGCIDIDFSAMLDEHDRPVNVLEYELEILPYYRESTRIKPHG